MNESQRPYLLAQAPNEVERLSALANAWEPATEALFEQIPVQAGWHCLDMGCGARGALAALARRVGPAGRVVGVDLSQANLAAAAEFMRNSGFTDVELAQGDVFHTNLPRESFDLVHERFMFAPLGHESELLREMLELVRPGGVVVVQESCEAGYETHPAQPAWQRLKEVTVAAFSLKGGDYNAGRRTYGLLRQAGCQRVNARAAVLALPAGHPYRHWPLESAMALRHQILESGLMTEGEFQSTLAACQLIADDPDIWMTSFMVTQVWGFKPRVD